MRKSVRGLGLAAGALVALTLVSGCAYDVARDGGYSHVRSGNWGARGGYGATSRELSAMSGQTSLASQAASHTRR
jgi:hypothetical protein